MKSYRSILFKNITCLFFSLCFALNLCSQACRCEYATYVPHDTVKAMQLDFQMFVDFAAAVTGLNEDFQFEVHPTYEVSNFAAITVEGNREIIWFNPGYARCVRYQLGIHGHRWDLINMILLHEMAHHARGHCDGKGSNPSRELEADYESGYYGFKLFMRHEVTVVMELIASPHNGKTHPGKEYRICAILSGYDRAEHDYNAVLMQDTHTIDDR